MGRYDRTLYGRPLRNTMDIFYSMDRDRGGSISLGEFREGLKRMDIGLAPGAITDLLTVFDLDGNGEIDEQEFRATLDIFGEEADTVFSRSKFAQEERLLNTTHKRRKEISGTHSGGYGGQLESGPNQHKVTGEMKRHLALQGKLAEAYSHVAEEDLQKRLLCEAVQEGKLADVKRLVLEEAMDPSTELSRGQTVLHLACYHGQFHVAKFLALSGADIWRLDLDGNLPAALLANEKHRNELYQLANYILQGEGDLYGGGPINPDKAQGAALRAAQRNQQPLNMGGIGSAGGLQLHKASGGLGSTAEGGSNLSIRRMKEVVKHWEPSAKRTLFGYTGRALEKVFGELDADRDGLVSASEFHTAMYRLRVELPPQLIDEAIEALQLDVRPRYVEYMGFAQCISKYKCWILSVKQVMDAVKHERRLFGQSLNDMKTTFQAMDSNGDGELDAEEFANAMRHLDVGLNQHQTEEMMSAFDLDGNGRLDLDEFCAALQAYKEAKG